MFKWYTQMVTIPVERPFGQTQSGPDILDELRALISSGALAGCQMDIIERAIQEIKELREDWR